MSEEELVKLCEENFLKNIKKYLKSETIFMYVDNLEKENKKQKEVLDKIKSEYINHLRKLAETKGKNGEENGALYVAIADLLELLEEIE